MAILPAGGRPRRVRVLAVLCSLAFVSALTAPVAAVPLDVDGLPMAVLAETRVEAPAAVDAAVGAAIEGDRPPAPVWDGVVAPPILATAAVIIDEQSGVQMYGHHEQRRLPPASITKIMTALLALERGNLDDEVTVVIHGPRFAWQTDSSIMGLLPGDRLTLRDLLYGLMLPSGNDAALEIARHIAGSEAAFVRLMNDKARALGLHDSHFVNPHGLHDAEHYTTARDITQIGRAAMRDPRFVAIAGASSWTVTGSRTYTIKNSNGLLKTVAGADGVKTGWHEQAGPTIVGSVQRDGRRIFITLLNDNRQLFDAAALADWAFNHFSWG